MVILLLLCLWCCVWVDSCDGEVVVWFGFVVGLVGVDYLLWFGYWRCGVIGVLY